MKTDTSKLNPEQIAKSWNGKFHFKKEVISSSTNQAQPGLRPPQIGALHAILAHIESSSNENGIIVMPTGTGKTETMLSFMVANQCGRTLVLVPSDALRLQTSEKYETFGILKTNGVVDSDTIAPIVSVVKGDIPNDEWLKIIESSNVIVTTMASAIKVDSQIKKVLKSRIDYLVVDEAHHSKAETWNGFIREFPMKKVFFFTATPYRNDGKKLEGKVIFNYSLKKAQEDGYFQPIDFLPISKYNQDDADEEIARTAIGRLREDMAKGYDHILMARCSTKKRASEIFELYKDQVDLSPVIIHSGIKGERKILDEIKDKKHRIIVCVDMLGEGFDLSELKIAAVHDIRQSLPITLQFIGRFIRTSKKKLGKACFITNIANSTNESVIKRLYQSDADWNVLLPWIGDRKIQEEQSAANFLNDFIGSLKEDISLSSIRPALSAQLFTCVDRTTNFSRWEEGITNLAGYKYRRCAHNHNMLVVVLGRQSKVQWGDMDCMENLEWDLILVYFDALHKRIFLNSTIDIRGDRLLKPIFGTVSKISGDKVFRIFANVKRLMLTNVGTRRLDSKDVSFQSFFGKSVEDGIHVLSRGQMAKNNIYGLGFRDGERKSLGCSIGGKIWSRERGDLSTFAKWCNEMGNLVTNETIDTNIVLKNTLRIDNMKVFPDAMPMAVDWNEKVYEYTSVGIRYGKIFIPYEDCSFDIEYGNFSNESILFAITSEILTVKIGVTFNEKQDMLRYHILSPLDKTVLFVFGSQEMSVDDFFTEYLPIVHYTDGSMSYGIHHINTASQPGEIPDEDIIVEDWAGVNLSKESYDGSEADKDSIQYTFAKKIWNNHNYIVNDDGAGEIADLLGIDDSEMEIDITLYHLKYAHEGKVSNRISNLYEVCGQAIKSVRWKYPSSKQIFDRILERNEKREKRGAVSSFMKGTEKEIIRLKEAAANSKKINLHIRIVQPGMSKSGASDEMRLLLGYVSQYLHDVSMIDFKVICSE